MKNKIALVTGAGRGIGAAAALLLAQNGYDVAINYHNSKDAAQNLVQKLQTFGVRSVAIQADLSDENAIVAMFAAIDRQLGLVTALVNNGGISGGSKIIEEIDFTYLKQVYHTNVFGSFLCTREAVKRMKLENGGAIVNISSLSARTGGLKMSAYSSSKAAINNFTIAVAREVAEYNIRINAISPGVIDTGAHANITEERRLHLRNSIPLQRMGNPQEIAEAVLWLLSDRASYVTGTILEITGGK